MRASSRLVWVAVVVSAVLGCSSTAERRASVVDEALLQPSVAALVNHTALDADLRSAFRCSAVLTGPTTVLTAFHCVDGVKPRRLDVVVGASDLCRSAGGADRHQVVAVRREPGSDLATLTLESAARSRPAELVDARTGPGVELTVIGWGRQADGRSPCQRVAARVRSQSASRCASALASVNAAWADPLCALPDGGRSTCVGDSGAPAFARSGGSLRVAGVTSSGLGGCGPASLSIYERVDTLANSH